MSVLISGTNGLLEVGPSATPTTVGLAATFEVNGETEINERGPYFGDATIRKTRGGKGSTGSIEVDIPEGRNAGQTAIIAAHEAGTNLRISIRAGDATNGYTYVAANAAITGVQLSGDASEGFSMSFEFADVDGYTLLPSS